MLDFLFGYDTIVQRTLTRTITLKNGSTLIIEKVYRDNILYSTNSFTI